MINENEDWSRRDVFALSYWAEEAPNQVITFCDEFVTVVSRRVNTEKLGGAGSLSEKAWSGNPSDSPNTWSVRTYDLELPDEVVADLPTELSGTYARLAIADNPRAADRPMILERSIADLMLWEITNLLLHSQGNQDRLPIMLIRGPLSSALRGRLLYRTFSAELPIVAISYEPADVEKLAAKMPLPNSEVDSRILTWHGPYPPLALDQGSRYFVAARSGKPQFVVEIPCTSPLPLDARSFWESRKRLCEWLFADENVAALSLLKYAPLVGLPLALAKSSDHARQVCQQKRDEELGIAARALEYCDLQAPYPEAGSELAEFMHEIGLGGSPGDGLLASTRGGFSLDKSDQLVVCRQIREQYYKVVEQNPGLSKFVLPHSQGKARAKKVKRK
jgi:hypothetical protein